MATWKKIVVSGSGVSQLANDAGYVASIGGGLISSSQQISDFNTFLEFQGDNVVSSSAQVISLLPNGTVSGSGQVDITSTDGYTTFSSSIATDITSNTSEISSVSSSLSARITSQENFSSSLDATFATEAELNAATASLSGSASDARNQLASDYIAADSALSASASTSRQAIADDLNTVSSSLSTRVTSLEDFSSSLDTNYVTEAELVAATASLSASLATDIATNADNITTNSSSAATALTNLSSSASTSRDALATDIATNTSDIATLNGKTLISGSTFSSPSQGTLTATINGVATNVDLGLQAADNVEFADALITGDLTVQGTASFQHTTDVDVADRFIRLASGSNANGDGGIVIQQDSPANGEAFAFDSAESRWGVTSSFDPSTNTIVPDAFMTTNVTGADNDPTGIASRYQKNGNIFIGNTGDIWIYS